MCREPSSLACHGHGIYTGQDESGEAGAAPTIDDGPERPACFNRRRNGRDAKRRGHQVKERATREGLCYNLRSQDWETTVSTE